VYTTHYCHSKHAANTTSVIGQTIIPVFQNIGVGFDTGWGITGLFACGFVVRSKYISLSSKLILYGLCVLTDITTTTTTRIYKILNNFYDLLTIALRLNVIVTQ